MPYYKDFVLDTQGDVVQGAIATVTNALTGTAATLYGNALRTASISNNITTGSDGSFAFYTKPGRYTISVSASNFTSSTTVDLGAPGRENVSDFGAIGNGSTDDTAAIQAAAAAVAANGSGELVFDGSKTYAIYPDALNTSPLGTFTNLRGIRLTGNGCTLTAARTFSGSQAVGVWQFSATEDIWIDGFKLTCSQETIDQTTNRGFEHFRIFKACRNVNISNIQQTGGRACVYIFRDAATEPTTARTELVNIHNVSVTRVGYGLVCAHSGDYVTARNLQTDECFRSTIVYGVRHLDLDIISRNHYSNDVDLGAFNFSPSYTDSPFLEDVKVRYRARPATIDRSPGPSSNFALVCVGTGAVRFRDIRIDAYIDNDGTYPEGVFIDTAKNSDASGTTDTTPGRGHTFDNIDIKCYAAGVAATTGWLNLWSDAAWVGEAVNGLNIHDFDITGNSSATWLLRASEAQRVAIDRVRFPGTATITGSWAGLAVYRNVTWGAAVYAHYLWNKAANVHGAEATDAVTQEVQYRTAIGGSNYATRLTAYDGGALRGLVSYTADSKVLLEVSTGATTVFSAKLASGDGIPEPEAFGPLKLKTYTASSRPAAASHTGALIYVSDAAGGSKLQYSDGTTTWVAAG